MRKFLALLLCSLCVASARAADGELIVPVRTIYPGETISPTDVITRLFDLREGQAQAYVRNAAVIEGKVARRTLLANQPVPNGAVEEPRLALVGRQLKIEYRQGGLVISTLGSALQSGGAGDVISARILDGGRTVSGTLQKDGSLRVGEGNS